MISAHHQKIGFVLSLVFVWWFALVVLPRPSDEDTHSGDAPPSGSNKVALIIEPRPLSNLVPLLVHMMQVVPLDWSFLFIGSDLSVASVGRSYATKHQQAVDRLKLLVLPEPWEIDSKEKVHRLLTDIRFYDEFLPGVDWILRFESDSILCANSPTSLNEWLHWSWAGAPKTKDDRFSGNGGLSLRRVSAIRRILGFQERYNDTEPEDEWFGKRLWVMPGEKVAAGLGGVLTVEDVYVENAMGYHVKDGGADLPDEVWKNTKQRKKIFEYCPELSLIMDMKLTRERCEEESTANDENEEPQRKLLARIWPPHPLLFLLAPFVLIIPIVFIFRKRLGDLLRLKLGVTGLPSLPKVPGFDRFPTFPLVSFSARFFVQLGWRITVAALCFRKEGDQKDLQPVGSGEQMTQVGTRRPRTVSIAGSLSEPLEIPDSPR